MESFEFLLEQAIAKIRRIEKLRKEIGEELRKLKLFSAVPDVALEGSVAAVDGGVEKKSLHGFDIFLLKAVGVVYAYEGGKLAKAEYYPSPFPPSEPMLNFKAYSDIELEVLINMQRQMKEVETATQVIEAFKPRLLLLDGSVLPHYTYAQSADSPLYEVYARMIESYRRLFSTAKLNGIKLAGVIKDSRGSRFCEIIAENFSGEKRSMLEESKDVSVLSYALQKGEMTAAFDYTKDPDKHPIVREFSGFKFKSFYFKPSQFDVPVRVDLLGEDAEEIAGLLLKLIPSESYAVPAPLIEADQRARVSSEEMLRVYTDLVSRLGPLDSLKEPRRDRRPF